MLEKGAPPEPDLFLASQQGIYDRVKQLLDSGENAATDRDAENCTALHWASINNHVRIAQLLIERGAQVDATGGELLATPLHWATRSGHVQIVSILHSAGADLTLEDNQGYNALHLAAHAGNALMIVFLLALGMDVNSLDTMGRTALMWSAYKGNSIDSLRELLRAGAALDLVDQTGYSALHWAVRVLESKSGTGKNPALIHFPFR
ncbi:ankyrin repeat-containing domain protein [Fimicolochytrium jonesii]|uniref:ankyrin repeat-containing domain protein n=1 Tax=Fimicolochytrium jonesii TaxID=1396493 RepID=UPI0022FF07D4|nr:ankyrin repeat-containing domain protein [Fimicolochytrium jonesii]KAI8816761.1 ankyrin repeat-containing domain protein [Fimicolochytrium jonesii]